MTLNQFSDRNSLDSAGAPGRLELNDLAAELTEAAFPIALRHGIGTDWLDRKIELWKAMTRTVRAWDSQAQVAAQ
jgi:hypothetical protein